MSNTKELIGALGKKLGKPVRTTAVIFNADELSMLAEVKVELESHAGLIEELSVAREQIKKLQQAIQIQLPPR